MLPWLSCIDWPRPRARPRRRLRDWSSVHVSTRSPRPAKPMKVTFMGLAGLGDLVLTCTDDQSRNRRLGLALGRGQSMHESQGSIHQVVEGVLASRAVCAV